MQHVRFSTDGLRLIISQPGLVTVRVLGDDAGNRELRVGGEIAPLIAFAPRDDVLVATDRQLRTYRLQDLALAAD